ncbi:helix-turn-helix transcriptional regulator [Curtobacterium sp. USHLN213]|uniref:helix-turn-helix transcriptional regulator n=1 Tax=Curtobacterium sp. USHLN213 TaxID=3081255 RepID=UPI0030194897
MELPTELRDFLVSRRARLTPQDAGILPFGGRRRVPGLRREELAHLAGVSVDYYTRFERGRTKGVSAEVVEAIARALQLNEVEREHLRNLVDAARPKSLAAAPRRGTSRTIPDGMQEVLDALAVPAFIQNDRMDVLAFNALGRALYPESGCRDGGVLNLALLLFVDEQGQTFYRNRDLAARNTVAVLRGTVARNPDDEYLVNLIGQLSTKSADFRALWAGQEVLKYRAGIKQFTHDFVGDVEFTAQTFDVRTAPELMLVVYGVAPDSRTDEAMRLLASWSAAPAELRNVESPAPDGGPLDVDRSLRRD